jgi:hypothetical protein
MNDTERLIIEVKVRDTWTAIGTVTPSSPPSSLAADLTPAGGREHYAFGWIEGHGPCVWRTITGVDTSVRVDNIPYLLAHTTELELVAEIGDEPVTVSIVDRAGTGTVRFRYERQRS